MVNINKLISNSLIIRINDGKTRVKYVESSGLPDLEIDIVGELESNSIPHINSIEQVDIGSHVTSIGESAFSGCSNLRGTLTIPDSVTDIWDYAFQNCSGLNNVTIGNSVTKIGQEAFAWCDNLVNVTIGNSVTSIGDGAFGACNKLDDLIIPVSVTSIGEEAFWWYQGSNITFSGKTKTTVQEMKNYDWDILSGCIIHCTDGDIQL